MAAYSATELTPAQVIEFQDSINAVLEGSATLQQAHECFAAIEGFWAWARLPWQAARDIIVGREQMLNCLPPEKHDAVNIAIDGKAAAEPRIRYDESDLAFPNIVVLKPDETTVVAAMKPAPPAPVDDTAALDRQDR